jgi:hypothetical protein
MIHTALAGLIIFLSLSFILVFIVLQHGITIEKIQFSSIKIEELYIKWNEKLCVEVELLEISSDHPSQDSGFNANALQDFLRNSALFIKWFERISLSTIHVKEIEGTFYYDDSERGYLNLMSPSFELESTLELEKNILHVNLHPFALKQYSSAFLGTLKIDIDKKKALCPLVPLCQL